MEELLVYIKNFSLESIIIGLLVFGLTFVIKLPIKKLTKNLEENKRKAINTIIIAIPISLAIVINILYFGLCKNIWFTKLILDATLSSYAMSIILYTIYERLVAIFKSIINKSKNNDDMPLDKVNDVSQNDNNNFTEAIKTTADEFVKDQSTIKEIKQELERLINLKQKIVSCFGSNSSIDTKTIDTKIDNLTAQKTELENKSEEKLTNFST